MARLARVVALGLGYHITQRGNRRQSTDFCDEGCQIHPKLLGQWCGDCEFGTGAFCLMDNHARREPRQELETAEARPKGKVVDTPMVSPDP
jgi:putative transposase